MRKVSVIIAVLLALSLTKGCIYDDRKDCVLSVSFSYAYNVKEADAFPSEVKTIALYIFDADSVLIETAADAGDFPEGYSIDLHSLPGGDYTFVALGRNRQVESLFTEFEFAPLIPGKSKISELTMRLNAPENIGKTEFAALYCGMREVSLKDGRQKVRVEMKKLTNRFRIILMPYAGGDIASEDFDIRITEKTAWLDYRGDKYVNAPITFKPFRQETLQADPISGSTVSAAVLADLMVSRLIYDDRPVLEIRDKNGEKILELNLAWFLSLQGIAEHRPDWSNQSYLDRQDCYNLTFFFDGNLFIKSHIVVNGWVLSLTDVVLG